MKIQKTCLFIGLDSGGSTVVEDLAQIPKAEGSNPAATTERTWNL